MTDKDSPPYDDPNLPGLSRHFNSATLRGRANVAKATYAAIFAGFIYYKLRSHGKTTPPDKPKNDEPEIYDPLLLKERQQYIQDAPNQNDTINTEVEQNVQDVVEKDGKNSEIGKNVQDIGKKDSNNAEVERDVQDITKKDSKNAEVERSHPAVPTQKNP